MSERTPLETLLDELVSDLPLDEAAYRARIGEHAPEDVADALVRTLESENPSREERTAASHLLTFGGAKVHEDRLVAVALDHARPRLVRAAALLALSDRAPRIFERLSPEDITLPAEAGVEELLALGVEQEEAMLELAKLLLEVPEQARPFLLQSALRMREAEGLPIEFLAAPLLAKKELGDMHETLVEALAQDAGLWGARYLETKAKRLGKNTRSTYEEAAGRIRERVTVTPVPPDVRAWIVPSDGSGTFQFFATAGEENVTLALVLGHVIDGVVDGAYYPNLSSEDVNEILEGIRSQNVMPVVPLPIGQAAAFLANAVAHPEKLEWPARLAVAFFESFRPESIAMPAPAPVLDRGRLETLLERPQYRAWLVEPASLPALPPEEGPERTRWRNEMMQEFGNDEIRILAAMARHNAWVLAVNDEADDAATLLRAVIELEEEPGTSILLELILDATATAIYELEFDEDAEND